MSLADKLERLARIVPGIGGYQRKETSRDTDKTVRLRLAAELEEQKRELEEDKRLLAEARNLKPLPKLDRLATKLDKLGNTIRYAPRGYRGVFDPNKHIQKSLDDLYDFDLSLFAEMAKIRSFTSALRELLSDSERLDRGAEMLSDSLDDLEKIFSSRQELLA